MQYNVLIGLHARIAHALHRELIKGIHLSKLTDLLCRYPSVRVVMTIVVVLVVVLIIVTLMVEVAKQCASIHSHCAQILCAQGQAVRSLVTQPQPRQPLQFLRGQGELVVPLHDPVKQPRIIPDDVVQDELARAALTPKNVAPHSARLAVPVEQIPVPPVVDAKAM